MIIFENGRVRSTEIVSTSAQMRELADAVELVEGIKAQIPPEIRGGPQEHRAITEAFEAAMRKPPPGAPLVKFDRNHIVFAVKQHATELGAEATCELLADLMAQYELEADELETDDEELEA